MSQQLHLLIVDDDELENESLLRAFRQHGFEMPVTVVSDGVEALKVLRGESGQAPLSRPYIILLDLYLPRMNGIEFIHVLRQDPDLKGSLVFAFTRSRSEQDIRAAYRYAVAGYIVKDKVGQTYQALITLLESYQAIVALPQ